MLLVIFGIGFVVLLAGVLTYVLFGRQLYHNDQEWVYYALNIVGSIICMVSLITILGLGIDYSNSKVIDEKIALYETQNAEIESEVFEVVQNYMNYESDAFKNLKPETSVALLTLYPELKSNELVKGQIELYVENNSRIIELKEEKLRYRVLAWWLFFGE